MPPGIPVATVGINASLNSALLAVQIIAASDNNIAEKFKAYKENLKQKIEKANEDFSKIKFKFKTN